LKYCKIYSQFSQTNGERIHLPPATKSSANSTLWSSWTLPRY